MNDVHHSDRKFEFRAAPPFTLLTSDEFMRDLDRQLERLRRQNEWGTLRGWLRGILRR